MNPTIYLKIIKDKEGFRYVWRLDVRRKKHEKK